MIDRPSFSPHVALALAVTLSACEAGTTTSGDTSTGTGGDGGSTTTSVSQTVTGGAGGGGSTGTGATSSGGASSGGATSSGGGGAGGATSSGGTMSSGGGGTGGAVGLDLLPVAPDSAHFMWQSLQTSFVRSTGEHCTGRVTIAVGDQAVCYGAADHSLRCAGKIHDHVFGPVFQAVTGVSDVQQILISPTANSPDHNSICVLAAAGPACMGGMNEWGQFGTGDQAATSAFVPWGAATGVVALATGTWSEMCALTGAGEVLCSGYSYGPTPVVAANGAETLWVDSFGMVNADDLSVFRVSNGRTDCQVTAQGLDCDVGVMGTPGDVVDGTYTLIHNPPGAPPGQSRYCWLSDDGSATCAVYDLFQGNGQPVSQTKVFQQRPVLALAGNPYTTSLCAVYNDGSLACTGNNAVGQLGVPNLLYVMNETIVAPPGSIDLTCQ